MRLTTIFGLPIAETDDPRRDFPLAVDDPRTTAIENLLGKSARDTGWRSIASSHLTNGWVQHSAAMPFAIRRFGSQVILGGLVKNSAVKAPGTAINLALPGFSPAYPVYWHGSHGAGALGLAVAASAIVTVEASNAANGWLSLSQTWMTSEAWPSSLPGTPL